jgi:hypothetical protein
MENVLFKISFPAEFHAQTAVECALALHPLVKDRLDQIERIAVSTQESAVRIISKTGPLYNPADRDHCIQYMLAVPLIFGRLTADDYENRVAADPRIDQLRQKMEVVEDPRYTRDYLDPEKRSIANAGIPHRPPAAAQGRHSPARSEVCREHPHAPARGARAAHHAALLGAAAAGSHARRRIHGPVADIIAHRAFPAIKLSHLTSQTCQAHASS